MTDLVYGSICSGIEAATVAWHSLGWRPAFFAEIDGFPQAVLRHHYGSNTIAGSHKRKSQARRKGGVPNLGDFTGIRPRHLRRVGIEPIELLVGGTPCQSFSVAGKRLGMDDPRGNLALEYLALARRLKPRWLVFENVRGLLSSGRGRDFGAFLGTLGECGYGWAYRVFDSQFIRVDTHPRAVPQRRRRVFVVGYLGDWRPATAVLFEPESLHGDSPPRREAGQGAAPTIASRPSSGGGLGTDFDLDADLVAETLRGDPRPGSNSLGQTISANGVDGGAVSHTLKASASPKHDPSHETYVSASVSPTLRSGGNATGGDRPPGTDVDTCDSLVAVAAPLAFDCKAGGKTSFSVGAVPGALRGEGSGGGHIAITIPFDTTQITSKANGSSPKAGDPCHPLAAGAHPPAIAFSSKDHGGDAQEDVAPTLRAMGHDGSHANAGGQVAVAIQERAVSENLSNGPGGKGHQEGVAYTLEARNKVQAVAGGPPPATALNLRGREGGSQFEPDDVASVRAGSGGSSRSYVHQRAVRRLIPRECERLQAFEDDYTRVPWRKRSAARCPDGPRYKALGNSKSTNVIRWIGQRIDLFERTVLGRSA